MPYGKGTYGSKKGRPPKKDNKKSPVKKPLVGKQNRLPKELKDAILAAPAKMLKPSAMKMMKKSVAKMGYKKK
jgi:hypothetical protein|tara:strand:+ start:519 stop:737 length:219 start_codon:yes stop_codon:yes gene_type:complete